MLKEYCIAYEDKKKKFLGWKKFSGFFMIDAHKMESARKMFRQKHPNAVIEKEFVEYIKGR